MKGIQRQGRFADEDDVGPKRKVSWFWHASCLEMQPLGLGALRVSGLGLTQGNYTMQPPTKTPVWGEGDIVSCTHQQHPQGQKAGG